MRCLNLLGTETRLWNRSTLVRVLYFPLRSAGRTKLPAFVSPTPADVRKSANVPLGDARESCPSLQRDRRPQTRVENELLRRRPKPERRSAKIKSLLIFSPPPILSAFCCVLAPPKVIQGSQPGKIFQRHCIHMFV